MTLRQEPESLAGQDQARLCTQESQEALDDLGDLGDHVSASVNATKLEAIDGGR